MAVITDSELVLEMAISHTAAGLLWHWFILLQANRIILYNVDIKCPDAHQQELHAKHSIRNVRA